MRKITLLFLFLMTFSFGYTQELVTNGDFQTGDGTSWYNGALNIVDLGAGNWVNQAEVLTAGNPWDANISQDIILEDGKTYLLTYDAWTDAVTSTRSMTVGIGQNGPGWANVTAAPSLTDIKQTFTHLLTVNYGNDVDDRIIFDMGAEIGFVFIDNVSVVEFVDTAAPTSFTATVGAIGIDTIELLLNANDNSGEVIYDISYNSGANTLQTTGTTGDEKSLIVTGLDSETAYTFEVSASDAADNTATNNPITALNATTLTGTTSAAESNYCATEITHLNLSDPNFVATAINLTIENTGASTMKITAESADITFLALEGAITGNPVKSDADSSVSGEVSITVTWSDTPPADVTFQFVQWEKSNIGGRSQIENANTPFDGVCGPPATPAEDTSLSDLQLDNVTISGFDSATTDYIIELADTNTIPQVGNVSTTNNSAMVGVITQATTVPGNATFDVTSEDTNNVETYTINFIITSPQTAAPIPPARDEANVVSIYSDAYTTITPINYDVGWCNGGQPGAVTETTAGGDAVFAYNDKACQGINFENDLQDVTGFTNIHVDLFIKEGTDIVGKIFNIKIVPSAGAETAFNIDINGLNPKPVPGTWFSYDVPVNLTGPTTDIKEVGITSNLLDAVWYDNLYLYKEITSSTCSDGIQNGNETGIDCGGPDCDPCTVIAPLNLDFETTPVTADFTDFDGGGVTIIANPQGSGNVAQLIRNGGQIWAGSFITLDNNPDFSTLTGIKMKVWTAAPIGTKITIKTEGGTGSGDKDAFTTVTGAWETLTYDFTGAPGNDPKLTFLFDFGNIGDGSAASTFLFDDIEQFVFPTATSTCSDGIQNGNETGIDCGGPDCDPCTVIAPLNLDFETTPVTADFTDFDGGGVTVIANPQGSGNVAQLIRNGGQIWAGSFLTLTNNPDFSTLNGIKMKVWTEAPIGTKISIKTEGGTSSGDKDAYTTVTSAWETLTYNFTGAAADNNKLTFLFDFGNVGDGSGTSTFLFDDVEQFDYSNLSVNNFEIKGLKIYPNPTKNQWFISTNGQVIKSIEIYNIIGENVLSLHPNSSSATIDASRLTSGMYISKMTTELGTQSKMLIKN